MVPNDEWKLLNLKSFGLFLNSKTDWLCVLCVCVYVRVLTSRNVEREKKDARNLSKLSALLCTQKKLFLVSVSLTQSVSQDALKTCLYVNVTKKVAN